MSPTPSKRAKTSNCDPKSSTITQPSGLGAKFKDIPAHESLLEDLDYDLWSTAPHQSETTSKISNESTRQSQNSKNTPDSSRQVAIDGFISVEKASAALNVNSMDVLASKVADLVVTRLNTQQRSSPTITSSKTINDACCNEESALSSAENLKQFLEICDDFVLEGDPGKRLLLCVVCHEYLKTPLVTTALKKRPTGGPSGSLSLGMHLTEDDYQMHVGGHNSKWYRLKKRMIDHLSVSNDTHLHALSFKQRMAPIKRRGLLVVKNLLRTALGVVKTKSAARQYESRVAELWASGGDVGDYSHSRTLFVDMLKVACAYIDKEISSFLEKPLPNTGLAPHFYVTADKSTNHRVTNQACVICPVVEGERQGILLSLSPVYTNADGTGGVGNKLADLIYEDINRHANMSGSKLMAMQGKVMDGQYLTAPFVQAMNKPLFQFFPEDQQELARDPFWWPCEWDHGHWLDKVFEKFKDTAFVNRLLKRTALFHQLFRFGKMHSVAKETAKDLKLPFRVTVPFAVQRFMSSSYQQLLKLEKSFEAYVETFRDHDNRPLMEYQLAGNDFVFDLLGVIDLLWPLVILMLRSQLQWCPGWKFIRWVPLVQKQFELFSPEIVKRLPSHAASPRLYKHGKSIEEYKFGTIDLVEGWLVVKEEQGKPIDWSMREIVDCKQDLKQLALAMNEELKERFESSVPDLSKTLHKCLDFGILFDGVCGIKTTTQLPVNKNENAKLGKAEFRKVVEFVSVLPHVIELTSKDGVEFGYELTDVIFWKLKAVIIKIVWGELFHSLFHHFCKTILNSSKSSFSGVPNTPLGPVVLPNDVFCVSFTREVVDEFNLSDIYKVILSNKAEFLVVLQEDAVIKALYTNPLFYQAIGREFCIIFDIMYSKTGTEAVAESVYRVAEKQEQDAPQGIDVLGMRTKVDWCFPDTVQCDRALESMADLYLNGDKSLNLKKHHIPIYKDVRSIMKKDDMSKVIKRIATQKAKLPFLL